MAAITRADIEDLIGSSGGTGNLPSKLSALSNRVSSRLSSQGDGGTRAIQELQARTKRAQAQAEAHQEETAAKLKKAKEKQEEA